MNDIRNNIQELSAAEKRALLARIVQQRAGRLKTYPLSFAQQRLWFLDQVAPGNPFYNIDTAFRLPYPLEVAVLEQALNEIVARHDSLRTTFKSVNGDPVQAVAASLHVPLTVVDLRHLPPQQREEEAVRLATAEGQRGFDLSKGPLIRTKLLQLGDEDYMFLLTLHHIISDGWSMTVFFNELTAIYTALSMGEPSPLSALKIQYPDFAAWQRNHLQGEVLDKQLRYWQEKLADLPVLSMPVDRPRPQIPTMAGAFHMVKLPRPLMDRLKELARREGVTFFMLLLAGFKSLLHRYTGQDDIVIGSPIANRNRAEIEGLIGFFVNMLVMRTDLAGDPPFREALQRVRETALDAYAHQDMPFEKLVEELEPERDMSLNPMFQVSFQLFNDPSATDETSEEVPDHIRTQRGTANIDLAFDAFESAQGLTGTIEYSTDLFDDATIARLLGDYQTLLESVVENPDRRLSQLNLMTPAQRHTMLVEWNETTAPFPDDKCLHELFEEQVQKTAEATALVYENQRLSYRELNRRANQLAHHLRELGVGPETLVGLCIERSPAMIVGLLAILKTGGAYLPIDATYPARRIDFMLKDSAAPVLLTQKRLQAKLPASQARVVVIDDEALRLSDRPTENPRSGAAPRNLAYVIYTSGSTGDPKGVAIEHRSVCNHLHWFQQEYPLSAADSVPQKYSLSFDVATLEILAPLLAGSKLVLVRPRGEIDSEYLVELFQREKVTAVDLVPSLLELLLKTDGFAACRDMRRVTCGGEALSPQLQQQFFDALDAELHNLYGPTEATIGATFWRCRRDDRRLCVPIGRPIYNTQLYVLDRHLNPVPVGVAGELHIGGVGLARGYLHRPELTAERFISHPFSDDPAARLYKSGDLVRWLPDGNIEFLGRVDQQVKVRGFRIELGEIESRLKEHPAIDDAVAVVRHETNGHAASSNGAANGHVDLQSLADALTALSLSEAADLFQDVESLSEAEAAFLLVHEKDRQARRRTVIRKCDEFELFLRLQDSEFIRPPQENQRNWVIQRVLDELTDDLRYLDEVSQRFVQGSRREEIRRDWTSSHAEYDDTQLVIEGQQVMQDWERPLMQAMADIVTETHGDVVEIGFGMGISATMIQERGVRSHTIIECNDDVAERFERWRSNYPDRDIRLARGTWQEAAAGLGPFDGVFFDAYPLSEDEFQETVINSITFAESFFPTAAKLLRPGGIFTYYTNEIDSFSRRHQRLVFKHFSSFTLSVVRSLLPPEDCNYWWADSMAAIKAVK